MISIRHTLYASFVFWGIGFILGITAKFSAVIATVLASGLTVTVIIVATWAVLGTGKYYVRFPVAFLFGLIPFSAILVGLLVLSPPRQIDRLVVAESSSYLFFSLCVLTQVPFWVFRGWFGWRLTNRAVNLQENFPIGYFFAVMFVFALAIVSAEQSSRIITRYHVENAENLDAFIETSQKGAVDPTKVINQNVQANWAAFIALASLIAVVAFSCTPLLQIFFRTNPKSSAWTALNATVLAIGAIVFWFVGYIVFAMFPGIPQKMGPYFFLWYCITVATLAVICFAFRRKNVRLLNRKNSVESS